MIGFAPANDPQVAVAVVVPQQANSSDGAGVAGPDHEQGPAGGRPAVVGDRALQRAARPDVELHRGALRASSTAPHRRACSIICVSTQVVRSTAAEEFRSAVGMLKLLADETRLRVICALLEGEHPVNELAELVGAQPAAVSQHLAKLRLARLVRSRREGTRIFYVLDDAHVRRLVEEVLSHADHVTAHG